MELSRLIYRRKTRLEVVKLCALGALIAAALYLLLARSGRWGLFLELTLGFATAVYVTAIAGGWLRSVALTAASVLFCFIAAEGFAMVQSPRAIDINTPGYSGARPILGWGPQHAGTFHHKKIDGDTGKVIYEVDYTVDEYLNRQVISATTGPTIAFFGDSMTFGTGLNDADTLPQAFADATGRRYRVFNFAIPGYGPQQFLRAVETDMYRDLLTGTRLFVMLTAAWHAERSNCSEGYMYHAPRYVLVDGVPTYAGWCADDQFQQLRQLWVHTAIYNTFIKPVSSPARAADMNLYTDILIRAGQLVREKYGVPTLILYLPLDAYVRRAGTTDEQLMQRLRDSGLIVVNADLKAEDFPGQLISIPGDGHPTGVANRARSLMVRDVLTGLPPGAH